MCQTATLFTRNSAKNHLATHGITILDYEKRYGAPLERVLPSLQSEQSQPVPSPGFNVGHAVAVSSVLHLPPVCTPSEQPPSNPGNATSQLHSDSTYPVQPVQPVPHVSGDSIHPVLHHHVDPEPSIFDPQLSSISIRSSRFQIYSGNPRPGILGLVLENDILGFNYRYSVCKEVTACSRCHLHISTIDQFLTLSPYGIVRN